MSRLATEQFMCMVMRRKYWKQKALQVKMYRNIVSYCVAKDGGK